LLFVSVSIAAWQASVTGVLAAAAAVTFGVAGVAVTGVLAAAAAATFGVAGVAEAVTVTVAVSVTVFVTVTSGLAVVVGMRGTHLEMKTARVVSTVCTPV